MAKRKRPIMLSRSGLVAKCDMLFSLATRLRDKKIYNGMCPFCGNNPIQCSFHFVTRAKYSTRWDFTNAVGACKGCNFHMEFNANPYILWYIKTCGERRYESLVRRSDQLSRFSCQDLRDLCAKITSMIELGNIESLIPEKK